MAYGQYIGLICYSLHKVFRKRNFGVGKKIYEFHARIHTLYVGGDSMKIYTYAQLESILRTAFDLDGSSIKTVATIAGLNLSSLYKWNSGSMRFMSGNMDRLLL